MAVLYILEFAQNSGYMFKSISFQNRGDSIDVKNAFTKDNIQLQRKEIDYEQKRIEVEFGDTNQREV